MKAKWIFTILLASSYFITSAQYHPFPQSDAIWEGSFIGFVGLPQKQYYVLCGDTTLNSEVYNKLYAVYTDTMGNIISQDFLSGIREDSNKKIWSETGQGAVLLYDFNLEPGDTFPAAAYNTPNYINEIVVDSIGEIEVDGEMRRAIFFEQNMQFRQEFWIEGIGSNYNILDRGLDYSIIADYEAYLECFRINNELLLNLFPGESICTFEYESGPECAISTSNRNLAKADVSMEVYPNPAQNLIDLNITGNIGTSLEIRLYNIYGTEVLQFSPIVAKKETITLGYLSPGMYFLQLIDPAKQTQIALTKLLIQH